jgi:sugar lactone lactonase YvrE
LSPDAIWLQNAITVGGLANGVSGSSLDEFNGNFGLYMTQDNSLYVVDNGNYRVVILMPNSTTAVTIVANSSDVFYPTDVFVTNTSIYILDSANYRVKKWSIDRTNPIIIAGITGSQGNSTSLTTFSYSDYLYVDNYDYIYVADKFNSRVLRFMSNSMSGSPGIVVAGNGTAGSDANQLYMPAGMYVDNTRALYIADMLNHRIQKWAWGLWYGVTVAGSGRAGNSLTQLNQPRAIIIDSNSYMYILDGANNRVLRWAINATAGVCIAACTRTTGTQPNQLNSPVDITFDSDGSLYVSDYHNDRVQKFEIMNYTGK